MRDFLMSRRARLAPEAAGIPAHGRRRVPGLRREEVAELAQVSTEYYVQIERGRLAGISNDVLGRIADALQLCEVERRHFANLARNLRGSRAVAAECVIEHRVPRGIQTLMELSEHTASVIMTPRLDLIASNRRGRALFAPVLGSEHETPGNPKPNAARFAFLDERSREFCRDWEAAADSIVALMLLEWGRSPHDVILGGLITRLLDESPEFGRRWVEHSVIANMRVAQRFRHPDLGDIELHFETLEIPGSGGLVMLNFFAAPGDPAAAKLELLKTKSAPAKAGAG